MVATEVFLEFGACWFSLHFVGHGRPNSWSSSQSELDQLIWSQPISYMAHHFSCFDLPALPASAASCFATHLQPSSSFLWCVRLHQRCFCYRWSLLWDLLISPLPQAFHVGTYKRQNSVLLPPLGFKGWGLQSQAHSTHYILMQMGFGLADKTAKSFTRLTRKCGTTTNRLHLLCYRRNKQNNIFNIVFKLKTKWNKIMVNK